MDLNQTVLAKAENRIYDSLKRVAKKMFKEDKDAGKKFVCDSLRNINFVTNAEASLQSADIVVEAIGP